MKRPSLSDLSVAIAVACGAYEFRSFNVGSAAHRAAGKYKPTPFDLERIQAAKDKRKRREFKRHMILQSQRIRAHAQLRAAA